MRELVTELQSDKDMVGRVMVTVDRNDASSMRLGTRRVEQLKGALPVEAATRLDFLLVHLLDLSADLCKVEVGAPGAVVVLTNDRELFEEHRRLLIGRVVNVLEKE